jgi:hypothetical protein
MAQEQLVTTTSVCRLMTDPDNTRTTTAYIPTNTELTVLEIKGEFILVTYNEGQGYINSNKVEYKNSAPQPQQPQQTQYTQSPTVDSEIDYMSPEFQKARFEILVEKYGLESAKALYNHKIWKGISHNMVRDSWGKPLEIRRTINSSRVTEEWIYKKHKLVFIDDVLSQWGPVK